MDITNKHNFLNTTDTSDDPLEKIMDKYKIHSSVLVLINI